MEPSPLWTGYQVRFRNGTSIKKCSIRDWIHIENYVRTYGLGKISRITCYFDAPHYPYKNHVLILQSKGGCLEMVFHSYYNAKNQLCVLPSEQQQYDCQAILLGLQNSIVSYYIKPPMFMNRLMPMFTNRALPSVIPSAIPSALPRKIEA